MKDFSEYLKILDRPEIKCKSHFLLACAAAGLETGNETYDETIAYEIGQLRNIKKIANMFGSDPELALLTYKAVYRLVLSAGVETDPETLSETFVVRQLDPKHDFRFSMEPLQDAASLVGIDVASEIWSILVADGGIKR